MLILCGSDNRAGERVLAKSLEARGHGKQRIVREGVSGENAYACDAGLAFGQRAGLIDDQRIDSSERLEGFCVADEHTGLRTAAYGYHDGHWRGETQGARAGDDEH